MHNCGKEVRGYHDEKVRLGKDERNEMRDRRDTNRTRVKEGLKTNKDPKPMEFYSQGSYAMKTMTQHRNKDYDIDDGIYFDEGGLKKPDGAEKSALEARQMIRDAVDDGSFNRKPDVRPNCVRVYYEAGYHVDLPVYRRASGSDGLHAEEYYELASDDWKRSDARDVTAWFERECERLSADNDDGGQLRRICRLLKKFARSREAWRTQIASGFMITELVTECYQPSASRDDRSLVETMRVIRDRLIGNLVVDHPVTPNETITDGESDPKAEFLKGKLTDALSWLEVLSESDCTQKDALKAWDRVFNTDYFVDAQDEKQKESDLSRASAVLTSGIVRDWSSESRESVNKRGGGRYA